MLDILETLGVPPAPAEALHPWLIVEAVDDERIADAYRVLRHREFVDRQGLFGGHDFDAADADPDTVVLVAMARDRTVLGGVRIHREDTVCGHGELGWWRGSRLVVDSELGPRRGAVGAALVRAACAHVTRKGALRFDAHVQRGQAKFFGRLGWEQVRPISVAGRDHELMRWPIDRFEQLAAQTKQPLGTLLGELLPRDRWLGDDGVPVADTGVVSCLDAITPSMVQRDPEWAGWCGMLVTAHDLAAMGAAPLGALDALAAPDAAHAERVVTGIRRGADAFDLPILGGHTQLGVHAALSVTGLGRAAEPIPAGGGRVGDALTLTADLAGGYRPGYHGRQWDSTSWRTREQLREMLDAVGRARPHAAKDVSMAGVVGTAGMLAEASGCGAELVLATIPRPHTSLLADWLTCFPGFATLTADRRDAATLRPGPARSAQCGSLVSTPGIHLRWPDGELTTALSGAVCGLGRAAGESQVNR
jgi:putative N-acetyltransferase (TIGR04045 family)